MQIGILQNPNTLWKPAYNRGPNPADVITAPALFAIASSNRGVPPRYTPVIITTNAVMCRLSQYLQKAHIVKLDPV